MSQLGHLQTGFTVGDLADLGQVGACREDKRLAGDGNARDLTAGRPLLLLVEDTGKLQQSDRAERVGARVIHAVIESDESQDLAAGDGHVAHEGVGDNLVLGERGQLGEALGGGDRHYFAPL